jgi:nucleoside phosphorylase
MTNKIKYIEKPWQSISNIITGDFILLMTATDLETNSLHNFINPLDSYTAVIKSHNGSQTYYLGKFGNYKVAHVQCGMGSMSREGSILTTTEAIKVINPKFLLMIGIAFGIDDTKQKIGDVLVSEAIIPYNFKRVGKKDTIIRSVPASANKTIVNRFKNLRTWEFLIQDEIKSELICGHILSGEELIDNKTYRDKLLLEFPTAKGGEMEGAGIVSACDGKLEWILVKGICDFADGNKHQNKDGNQKLAVEAAISLCLEAFSSKTAFEEFGILTKFIDKHNFDGSPPTTEEINLILFDLYVHDCEKYYIQRNFDSEFNNALLHYGIWLCGPTGCGKSNLILRNLLITDKKYIQVSLANCIGQNIDEFFKEILFELTSYTEGINNQIFPNTYKESHRAIISLLEKHFSNIELILFIEEIPIENESEYKEFTEKILSLLISKSYSSKISNIKFVLSSINSPQKHIHLFQQKVFQQIKFIDLEYWDIKDTERLVELITANFNIDLDYEFKNRLCQNSKGSPRLIKKFFRNLIAIGKFDNSRLDVLLKETKRELNIA